MSSEDPTKIEASAVEEKITTTATTPGSNRSSRRKPHKTPPTHPSKNHHSSSRHNNGSSSKKVSSGGIRSRTSQKCICGLGVACNGMTQAFRMLGDPRSYCVELPRYRKDPPAFKYVFRNNLRQAYLRQLVRQNPTSKELLKELLLSSSVTKGSDSYVPKRCYVALHHFHPTVVRAFYENPLTSAQKHRVPISITEHELYELEMECHADDRILSVSGNPTGGYYFTPSYAHKKAHDDLKVLMKTRTSPRKTTHKKSSTGTSSSKKRGDPNVPHNIEIKTPTNDGEKLAKPDSSFKEEEEEEEEKQKDAKKDSNEIINETTNSQSDKYDSDKNENDTMNEFDVGGDDDTFETSFAGEEFDKIWGKPSKREIESNVVSDSIIEEEDDQAIQEEENDEIGNRSVDAAVDADAESAQQTSRDSLSSRRSVDRPWATPKYRRDRDNAPKRVSGAADYIDPNALCELNSKLACTPEIIDDGEDIARIAADMTVFQIHREEKNDVVSPMPSIPGSPKRFSSAKTPYSPNRRSDDDALSLSSAESGTSYVKYVKLDHQLPGTDPTLRIQVHNDLIAWESKRRSDLAQQLEYNRERWNAACDVMNDGIAEAQHAERLILGISKASRLFADSLQAVYDDKLLDDKGNAVKNSFLQNRLAKQRSAFEYSIESSAEDSKQGPGQSILLDSIVNAQLEVAKAFIENSEHTEQEILPEITELKEDIQKSSRELESIGDAVILELKRSEIEVKNIWGKCYINSVI
jgi:hypothetical protein